LLPESNCSKLDDPNAKLLPAFGAFAMVFSPNPSINGLFILVPNLCTFGFLKAVI
jgi:hypothetical protein